MLDQKTVAVVIPAYNEEDQIGLVLENMPDFVDRLIVVDDCSSDRTSEVVQSYINQDKKDHRSERIGTRSIARNFYNEAEMVLQEFEEQEINSFVPSEIYNPDPDQSRIILIRQLKNRGVGDINGARITKSTVRRLWLATDKWILRSWKVFVHR